MNNADYKVLSARTLSDEFHITRPSEQRALHAAIGITTELVEILDALLKSPIDMVNLKEEIGDVFWYLAIYEREFCVMFERDDKHYISNNFFVTPLDCALNTISISGGMLDKVKKMAFYGSLFVPAPFVSEANKIFQNMCMLADYCDIDISEIKASNIEKLKARYPNKFDGYRADNRDLDLERRTLEQ